MSYAIIKPVTVEIAVKGYKNMMDLESWSMIYGKADIRILAKPYPELTIPKTFKISENIHKVDAR